MGGEEVAEAVGEAVTRATFVASGVPVTVAVTGMVPVPLIAVGTGVGVGGLVPVPVPVSVVVVVSVVVPVPHVGSLRCGEWTCDAHDVIMCV